jgi:hypothetical protein
MHSWTAILDAVRVGPTEDAAAVTAPHIREVEGRIIDAGHSHDVDPRILIVANDPVLTDLPVELVGRIAPIGSCCVPLPGEVTASMLISSDRAGIPTHPVLMQT